MRPQQKRRDASRPLEILDLSQETNIVNTNFTETDPRFIDTDVNKLNPNAEGQISGIENSQAQADYRAYSALRGSILEAGHEMVVREAKKAWKIHQDKIMKRPAERAIDYIEKQVDDVKVLENVDTVVSYIENMMLNKASTKEQQDAFLEGFKDKLERIHEDAEFDEKEREDMKEFLFNWAQAGVYS